MLSRRVDIFIKLCKFVFTFLSRTGSLRPTAAYVADSFSHIHCISRLKFISEKILWPSHSTLEILLKEFSRSFVFVRQSGIISKSLWFSGGPSNSLALFRVPEAFEERIPLIWFYSSFCMNTIPLPVAWCNPVAGFPLEPFATQLQLKDDRLHIPRMDDKLSAPTYVKIQCS